MSRFAPLVELMRSASRSIAGRLTIWFTTSTLLLLLAKALATYWMVSPGVAAQEEAYVVARAQLIGLQLTEAGEGAEALARIDGEASEGAPGFLRVVRADGHILAESAGMDGEMGVADFPRPGPAIAVRSRSGRRFWAASAAVGNGFGMVQVAAEANEFLLFAPTGGGVWLAVAMGFMLCGVVGHQIARHGIRPVQELVDVTHAIGGRTFNRRINMARLPTELLPLGETFNGMLDRLQQAFDRVSRFSDDIAHELKTPLTIMTSEIDVALAGDRSAREYREVLESAREEINALSELVHRLLFLSRAENQSVVLKIEPLDIARELAVAQEFYEPLATESGVALIVSAEGAPVELAADRVLLQRAIGNLLVNAVRHTPAGGQVVLAARRHDEAVRITVSDSGCGIDAEHLARVFDRFFRVDAARGSGEGHVGLGLAITKAIVALHRGTIEISSEPGEATTVAITLPLEWVG